MSRLHLHGRPLTDWLVPLAIFLFCGVVAYVSTTLDRAADIIVGHAMQPREFPLFLMIVIALLNLLLIYQTVSTRPKKRADIPYQTYVTAALFAVFYVVTVYIDMFVALALVLFIMCLVWGERRVGVAALVGVLTPTIIFFSFSLILKVRFPRGLLIDWYYG